MSSIKKYIYITIGFITFVLGGIGVFIPVLPTVPFLLLTSFCFAKGSRKFNKWFLGTTLYKNHLESFAKDHSMTLKRKICIVIFADLMMIFPLINADNLMVRAVLIIVILFQWYYFAFKIRTIR